MNVACQQSALIILGFERNELQFVNSCVARAGWRTLLHEEPQATLRALGAGTAKAGAALIDHATLGDGVFSFLQEARALSPGLSLVVVAANASAETGAALMRAGATDYLARPLDRDRLIQALRMATCDDATPRELQPLSEELRLPQRFETMIGADTAFRAALAKAAKAARTHRHVVIQGEGGTGKDTLLRAMHAASPRASSPLEVLRVRAFTATGIESSLFGHEVGAFAGAFTQNAGALEKCDGGTLLIEEINRLPMEAQARLAEVIASGCVRPLGASYGFKIDVRLLCTSNQPVVELLERRALDRALYEALSPVEITLPSLRNRRSDIPALARYFLSQINEQLGTADLTLTEGAVALLTSLDWPGNVRQLQAVLFRAAANCSGDVLNVDCFGHLYSDQNRPAYPILPPGAPRGGVLLFTDDGHLRSLEELETDIIRLAIGHYRGRMSEVARRLGIGRSTLYRKLAELNIETIT